MLTPRDYKEQIRSFDYDQLRQFWHGISHGETIAGIPAGMAFEHLILRAFEIEKADVIWPFEVRIDGDTVEQVDGAVYVGGLACIVEAKDHSKPIDFDPIAKLRSRLMRRPAPVIGVIFGRSGFTVPAKVMARHLAPQTILLWSGPELDRCFETERMCEALILKYRHAVEHGLPDYHILGEIIK